MGREREIGGGGGGGEVSWCFTSSQPVRLYKRERERELKKTKNRKLALFSCPVKN